MKELLFIIDRDLTTPTCVNILSEAKCELLIQYFMINQVFTLSNVPNLCSS